jgi:hypothetical protein
LPLTEPREPSSTPVADAICELLAEAVETERREIVLQLQRLASKADVQNAENVAYRDGILDAEKFAWGPHSDEPMPLLGKP